MDAMAPSSVVIPAWESASISAFGTGICAMGEGVALPAGIVTIFLGGWGFGPGYVASHNNASPADSRPPCCRVKLGTGRAAV